MMARLQKVYNEEVRAKVKDQFDISNALAVPRLEKIVINMGVGLAISDMKILEAAMAVLTTITGQKPLMTRSKKAISNFKLREDMPIGCKVTLRRARMYEFFDRLVNVAIPRIKDFNGLSRKSFDGQGNYTFGITDHAIFPEVDTGKISKAFGMDITFVFNHGPKERTLEVLSQLGMPFMKLKKENS